MKIIHKTDGRYRYHDQYTCLVKFQDHSLWNNDHTRFWDIKDWLTETYGPEIDTQFAEYHRNEHYRTAWCRGRERRIYLKDSSYLLFIHLALPDIFTGE
jgi:hypothetical protein